MRPVRHEWERDATLRLRIGDTKVADEYAAHGRVESGAHHDMLDLLFEGWMTDQRAGRSSLMLAADADTVDELNSRARAWRVRAGGVSSHGVRCDDGTVVGIGGVVVTRLNVRTLTTGRGWVKNGDDWVVTATGQDGSLRVTRPGGGAAAVLPADYLREHLELGYTSTAHRARGRTVDTAHAYVTVTTLREPLYVMASRGRESNRLYVDAAHEPDSATSHADPEMSDPQKVLQKAISISGADLAAHEVRRQERLGLGEPAEYPNGVRVFSHPGP